MNDQFNDGVFGDAQLLVLFDGYCGICTRCMEWLRARDPSGRVLMRANQTPGLRQRVGFTRSQVDRELYAIAPGGQIYRGAAAFQRIFYELGPPWSLLARCYDLPSVRWCADRSYAWFARNRGRFARWGATPACERPGASCEPEGA